MPPPDPAAIAQVAAAASSCSRPNHTARRAPLDAAAVAGIFAAKERPATDPLIVHLAAAADLPRVAAAIPATAATLAAAFWPGPLTLIVPRHPDVPLIVTAGLPNVAVRVPAHPVARALLAAAGVPVAAPSANRFSRPSPTTAAHVLTDSSRAWMSCSTAGRLISASNRRCGLHGHAVAAQERVACRRSAAGDRASAWPSRDRRRARALAPGQLPGTPNAHDSDATPADGVGLAGRECGSHAPVCASAPAPTCPHGFAPEIAAAAGRVTVATLAPRDGSAAAAACSSRRCGADAAGDVIVASGRRAGARIGCGAPPKGASSGLIPAGARIRSATSASRGSRRRQCRRRAR
jgi:hypothetical protein